MEEKKKNSISERAKIIPPEIKEMVKKQSEMKQVFTLHYCKDKLPEKDGIYKTSDFLQTFNVSTGFSDINPDWWLEEIPMPSDKIIRDKFPNKIESNQFEAGYVEGAKMIIDLIFKYK